MVQTLIGFYDVLPPLPSHWLTCPGRTGLFLLTPKETKVSA